MTRLIITSLLLLILLPALSQPQIGKEKQFEFCVDSLVLDQSEGVITLQLTITSNDENSFFISYPTVELQQNGVTVAKMNSFHTYGQGTGMARYQLPTKLKQMPELMEFDVLLYEGHQKPPYKSTYPCTTQNKECDHK